MAITVNHYERHGWPRYRWREGQFEGERQLRVAWGDVDAFLQQLDTYPNNVWPYPGGTDYALARAVGVRPLMARITNSASLASYEWAIVTVQYWSDGPQFYGGVMIEERISPAGKHVPVNWQGLSWTSNSGTALTSEDAFSKGIYTFDYVILFKQVLSVPAWVLSRFDCVNANNVASYRLGMTFAPETLLYKAPVISSSSGLGLLTKYDVVLTYGINPQGWNKQWRAATSSYDSVYITGGSQYLNHPAVTF